MEFGLRQNISQGAGCISKLKEILQRESWKRVLLVCGPTLYKSGAAQSVEQQLKDAEVTYEVFTNIRPNPEASTIDNEAVPLALKFKPDVIVAVGGGSTLDTAKGIAFVGDSGKPVLDYTIFRVPPSTCFAHKTYPLIAIPTTAGTGSEVCKNAVISDEAGLKLVLAHEVILPKYALLDPDMLKTMPFSVAAATSMDTFVQALETFTNRNANDFTRTQSLRALEHIGQHIRAFCANPADAEAANGMSLACMYAGFSLGLAGIGQDHIITHPMSEDPFYISHGEACAMVLPAVIEYNGLSCKELYRQAFNALTGMCLMEHEFEVQDLVDWVVDLNDDLHIAGDKSFAECGYTEELLEKIMAHPVIQGAVARNASADDTEFPRHTSLDDFRAIIKRMVVYSQAQSDRAKARKTQV